jgi:ABC-type transport system involved in multi-copper enzyme maturation permease subunit
MLLAGAAGLAGLAQIYALLVYLGILKFDFVGKSVQFQEAQWGAALWALIMAAIWLWVAAGFWNLRAYALQFGIFISLFTLIWGFFALLFGSTYEAQTIPWLLAGFIFLYLSYPGVQTAFMEQEMSRLTPEQKAAMEQLAAANAAANAKKAPGM